MAKAYGRFKLKMTMNKCPKLGRNTVIDILICRFYTYLPYIRKMKPHLVEWAIEYPQFTFLVT